MTFQELLEKLNEFKGTPEYDAFVNGFVNKDSVTAYLNTDDGKKIMQPRLDKYHNKSLETWKANNLQGLVDAKVKELYPEADPKDVEINRLKQELAAKEAEATRQILTNKAMTIANEKGLPVDLVRYFVGTDEDSTIENMGAFENAFSSAVSTNVEQKLKDTAHIPPKKDEEIPMDGVTAAFLRMNPDISASDLN